MSIFEATETWVAASLLIFLGILVMAKVPGALARTLDARAKTIQDELDEARRIRMEAEAMLRALTEERKAAEALAKSMLAEAKKDAKRLGVEAAKRLEETLARRQQVAERKIAQAEADAAAAVRASAVDLASDAAAALLTQRLAGLKSDPLVDKAVGQLADKLQ